MGNEITTRETPTDLDWSETGYSSGDSDGGAVELHEATHGFVQSLPPALRELSGADLAVAESFSEHMYEQNASRGFVEQALEWYSKFSARVEVDRADADIKATHSAEDELRSTWGDRYDERVDRIANVIETSPDPHLLNEARLPDGSLLFNNREFMGWLGALLFGELSDDGESETGSPSLEQERAEIERVMRESPQEYWSNESMQKRYRAILEELYPPAE